MLSSSLAFAKRTFWAQELRNQNCTYLPIDVLLFFVMWVSVEMMDVRKYPNKPYMHQLNPKYFENIITK